MKAQKAKHVWISQNLHKLLKVIKKSEGGKNLPFILEDLATAEARRRGFLP